MEEDMSLAMPFRVKLALYMLYVSLGMEAVTVVVTRLSSGSPSAPGTFLAEFLTWIVTLFSVRHPGWTLHGDLFVVPIAVWLYYMIARGRNWARIILLIWVFLEILFSILPFVLFMHSPAPHQVPATLSDVLIGANDVLQSVLQLVAVILLFGRISSQWFQTIKIRNRQPRTKTGGMIGLLGLLLRK